MEGAGYRKFPVGINALFVHATDPLLNELHEIREFFDTPQPAAGDAPSATHAPSLRSRLRSAISRGRHTPGALWRKMRGEK